MKFFAMIDGKRTGPWQLWQLPEAGVTPETYVWCKGMSDWRKAEEVADIARYYRCHLAGIEPDEAPIVKNQHSGNAATPYHESSGKGSFLYDALHPQAPPGLSRNGFPTPPPSDSLFEPEDLSKPPKSMLIPAILATLFCFPVTGFVGIYYAVQMRRLWQDAEAADTDPKQVALKNNEDDKPADSESLRRKAYDAARSARLWTGVTFFLGLIFWAFLYRINS